MRDIPFISCKTCRCALKGTGTSVAASLARKALSHEHARRRGRLLHRREANALLPVVEHRVVLAHEHVTEDPHLAELRREINAHEGEQALATHRQHVVAPRKRELLAAAERDLEVRERRRLAAVPM